MEIPAEKLKPEIMKGWAGNAENHEDIMDSIVDGSADWSSCFESFSATNITGCGTYGAGSYVVVNNISSAGIHCLVFNAGPVTLDLNGFTVSGTGYTNGILALNLTSVVVRNGTVKGFARSVNLHGTTDGVVDGVRALTGTNANGITVGDNGTVKNCVVSGHTLGGIQAGKNAKIFNDIVSNNTGQGGGATLGIIPGSGTAYSLATQAPVCK